MTLQKNNIALFASGNGSNVEKLLQKAKELSYKVPLIITDNPQAKVCQIAKDYKTPIQVIAFSGSKQDHESKILSCLRDYNIHWILLAGYMRILSKSFLEHFYCAQLGQNKVINIHPSLLPLFPGKQAYLDAFNANVKTSGVTIHFVDQGIDTGKIIVQKEFIKEENESFESFQKKGLSLEHELYPYVFEKIIKGNYEYLQN